jgi:hypothetical protein
MGISRRTRTIGALCALLLSVLTLTPTQANAASTAGTLQLKGPGSTYSPTSTYTSLAVSAGNTATFSIKVVNTGSSQAQFNVRLASIGLASTVGLFAGSLGVTPLAESEDGYFTNPIAGGGSQVMTLKVTPPAGSPQGSTHTYVYLYTTSGTFLGTVEVWTNVSAPTHGTSSYEVFARNGTQPYIGGSYSTQSASAPPIGTGASVGFNVKLQNDGPGATKIGFRLDDFGCGAFTATVKDGLTDVTAAALAGTYRTPAALNPGASRTLTVTVKNLGGPCDSQVYAVEALDPSSGDYVFFSYLNINRIA